MTARFKGLAVAITAAMLFPSGAGAAGSESAPAASILGTGIRVSDLDRSIRFYTDVMGMTQVRKLSHGTLTEIIMTFGGGAGSAALILMKDTAAGKSPQIELGAGFSKIIIDVQDMDALIGRMKKAGLPIGEVHSSMGVKVIFLTDPDGYRYEAIQQQRPISGGRG
ncbi:VOC family protein [Sphingobium tyrosinilyticum]|uniref:Aldoketomutase n=1 Tax=Sphingobium tyrosinilyticum TaxID=2715436 RepID=A0ABV9F306_9SPHN